MICALSGRDATTVLPATGDGVDPDRSSGHARAAGIRRQRGRVVVDSAPAYRARARQQGLLVSAAPGALVQRAASVTSAGPADARRRPERLRIVNPPSGATYLFDPTLRAEFQTLPLRAVAESSTGTLSWEIDGRAVGTSSADRALDWPRARRAQVVVSDGKSREETAILVK